MEKYKKGQIVEGVVTGIEPYGIFVSIDEQFNGMIHISEVSEGFVNDIKKYTNVGDTIFVEILDISNINKNMNLSIKNINYKYDMRKKRAKIIEYGSGFDILKEHLPMWIEENLKKINKF